MEEEVLTVKDVVNFIIKDNEPAKILNAIVTMVIEHQNFMISEARSQLNCQQEKRDEIYKVIASHMELSVSTQEVPRFEVPPFERKRP